MEIDKNALLKEIEFDIFSSELPVRSSSECGTSLKSILSKMKNPSSKHADIWKRVRMKLKYKSMLLSLFKDLQFHSDNPGLVASKTKFLNKFTRKKGLTKSYTNIEDLKEFMIHPEDPLKIFWNGVISFLLLYTAIVMPLSMAFYESDSRDSWFYLDLVTDGLFFLDVIITFNSAYYDNSGILVSSRKEVTIKYLKSWFLIDFLSSVPFNLITGTSHSYNSLLRLARLPRLAKLLRISKLIKGLRSGSGKNSFMTKLEDLLDIKTSAMRLFQGFLTIILMLHLMACLWYYSAKFQDFNYNTWVVQFGFLDMDIGSLYLRSLYFILTTLTTVGYGDIYANNDIERILVIIWIMIVMFFMTFNISSMSNMISSIDTKESILQYKISVIEDFCKEAKLKKELKSKLKDALKYSTENNGGSLYNKQDLILDLPKDLRFEVAMAMHRGYAKEIFFFNSADSVFVSNIIPMLISQRFRTDNKVYKEGDHPDELYFIVKGRIGYFSENNSVIFQQVTNNMQFGEIEIFVFSQRIFSTKAMVHTELLTLKKSDLKNILQKFPLIEEKLKKDAEKEKSKALRNMIEVKVIIDVKRNGGLKKFSHKAFSEEINKRFIKYQKTWREQEQEELPLSEYFALSSNIKERTKGLEFCLEKINNNIEKIEASVTSNLL